MIKESLLAEYDREMATTRRLLERVPSESLTWKPHAKSRSIGCLAQHIANIPHWGGFILERTELDLAGPDLDLAGLGPVHVEPASSATVMAIFENAATKTRKALDKTDGELTSMWSLRRAGQEMYSLPRLAAVRRFLLNHIVHHRGQLTVYLRLNDIPVPPIYGPSADES